MKDAIKIILKGGLQIWNIEFIQHLEKEFDEILSRNGFNRTTTTKAWNHVEINYDQFGKAL